MILPLNSSQLIKRNVTIDHQCEKGASNSIELHYEKKFTKNIRPTDILQIFIKFWAKLLNIQ